MRYTHDSDLMEGKKYSFQNKSSGKSFIGTLISKDGGGALTIRRDDPPVTLTLRVDVCEVYNVTDIGDAADPGRVRWTSELISSPSGPTDYSIDTAYERRRTLPSQTPTIFGYSTRHNEGSPTMEPWENAASRAEGTSEMRDMGGRENWRNANAYTTNDTMANTRANTYIPMSSTRNNTNWGADNTGFGLTRSETNRGWGGGRKRTRKSRKSKKSRKSRKSRKSKKSRKTRK